MKKNYAFLVFFLIFSSAIAQIEFEKGYFISNDGQRTDCYIKNEEPINNPTRFEYRLSPEGDLKIGRLENVKSFTIPKVFKYEKHTVNIDMTTKDLAKLNYDKNPEWQEKTLFLNVLVEGDATLYRYKNAELSRFFYKKGDGDVQQLVKKYYLSTDRKLFENNEYRQQLYTDLVCASISRNRVSKLSYNRNDLTKFFVEYNSCKNDDFTKYVQKSKGEFHMRAEIGVLYQKTIFNTGSTIFGQTANNVESEKNWSPKIGIDVEYILPFNGNKWAVFIAPYYQYYNGEGQFESNNSALMRDLTYEVDYAAIQVPLGIRHYIYLNDTSRIFLNGGLIVDIPLNKEFKSEIAVLNDDFRTSFGGVFGIGYNYNNYYAEARITTNRQLLEKSANVTLELSQLSFALGYRFL